VTPVELTELIRTATTDVLTGSGAIDTNELPATLERIDWSREIARPRNPAHGEYVTTVALRAAPALDLPARELAAALATSLAGRPGISSAEVGGPGFVNLRLDATAWGVLIDEVLADGPGQDWADLRERADEVVRAAGASFAELAAQVGPDVARYALLRSPAGALPRLDTKPLYRHTEDNPAFRVRFAHARLCALLRQAEALDLVGGHRYELLEDPRETALIRTLGEFATVVGAAGRCEPYRLARYLERLVDQLHEFERGCRVLPMGDEPTTDRHQARLMLARAVRQVLRRGLDILGVTAPEWM
jgi:arginyl-tRNA synthetase